MSFQEFLEKQQEVYERFRDTSKINVEGTKPNLPTKSQGGYLMILRHSLRNSQKVDRFSKKISDVVPAIHYDTKTIHTTITDYQVGEDFTPSDKTLDKLCECVLDVIESGKPVIKYSEWLYNQNTVIVAGMPNETFHNIANGAVNSGYSRGLQLRGAWGAHITASRFTKAVSPQELSDFFKLMKEAPALEVATPENIDVGYFNLNSNDFKINVYESFRLSRK